jgi:hypothetical protein
MNFFKKLFGKSNPPPSSKKELEEQLPYVLDESTTTSLPSYKPTKVWNFLTITWRLTGHYHY